MKNQKNRQGLRWALFFTGVLIMLGNPAYAGAKAASKPAAASKTEAVSLEDNPADDIDIYNKDPLEKFNRAMFLFNDTFDTYFMKPVAEVYTAIVPKPLNKGIHNFFINLSELTTIANDILQFNFYQTGKDTSRFVINTTLGAGGLFDIAGRMHIPHFHNDFGLTLARWGYKNSSYLVLPFLGPNTIRDGIGIPVDYYGFSVYPYIEPQSRRYQVLALFFVDYRANMLEFDPVLEEAAVDKYVFMRNAYMQRRAFQIEQIKHLSYRDRNQKIAREEVNVEQIK